MTPELPDTASLGALDSVTQARLHVEQLRWLRVTAAEMDTSISEYIRGLVWSAILQDPAADRVIAPEFLLRLVSDDDVDAYPATRSLLRHGG